VAGVARRALLVAIQLGLDLGEGLLGEDLRDRHLDPVFRWPRGMADTWPGRQHRRLTLPGGRHPGAVGQRPARIGRVAENPAHAGDVPAWLARRGCHPQAGQPPGELVDGCLRLQVPVEHLGNQHRLAGLDPDCGRVAGSLGIQTVAERRRGPRQQCARPQPGLPAAAHPLRDQRSLVLGHRTADLQQQLVVRIGAHRPVQELHLAAMPGKLLDQQHLVDVVAGQPVRRGHQHNVKIGQRRMVTQPVQPRPAKTGTAKPVIAVDMLVIQRPAALRGRRAQPVKLLLDGLRLGLAGGRHPRIHRRAHQAPPRRSAPGPARRPPPPSALTAGRPDPTGARRRDAGWAGGKRSTSGSSRSPTGGTLA